MTEHDIQAKIEIELCKRGCIVNRTNAGLYYSIDGRPIRIGRKGQSDLQGHRPDGKCFYIEVKKQGQNPRKEQLDFLQAMKSTGAIAGWADSVEKAVSLVFDEEVKIPQYDGSHYVTHDCPLWYECTQQERSKI